MDRYNDVAGAIVPKKQYDKMAVRNSRVSCRYVVERGRKKQRKYSLIYLYKILFKLFIWIIHTIHIALISLYQIGKSGSDSEDATITSPSTVQKRKRAPVEAAALPAPFCLSTIMFPEGSVRSTVLLKHFQLFHILM